MAQSFDFEMVFCYQNCSVRKNCSSDQEKLEQFIQTVKGQDNFSGAFSSNKLEHLRFKLEKIIGI